MGCFPPSPLHSHLFGMEEGNGVELKGRRECMLEMRDVTLSVAGRTGEHHRRRLLDGFSLRVQRGEICVLHGPSGCGKSTLLRALAKLTPMDKGEVLLDGATPGQLTLPEWRARVGYLPQQSVNLPGTPAETFEWAKGLKAQRRREHADIRAVGLELNLVHGELDQPWSELSGGQAQRAGLALLLARNPDVLLLDEVTSNCDPGAAEKIESLLVDTGKPVLWASHDHSLSDRLGARAVSYPCAL